MKKPDCVLLIAGLGVVTVLIGCDKTSTVSAAKPQFAEVEVCVVDKNTGGPLVGAVVKPDCMGGTPYGTNSYQTDANGMSKAMFYNANIAPVHVTMEGYEPANTVLWRTNALVAMSKKLR